MITTIEMYQSCNLIYQRVTNNLSGDAKVPTILHITSLLLRCTPNGVTSLHGRFFMLRYSSILKLKEQGLSLRSIAASTGNSRQKVTEVIERATDKGLIGPFDDDMTDKWIRLKKLKPYL